MGDATLVAGFGCRRGAPAEAIAAALDAALHDAGCTLAALTALATSTAKAAEPGLQAMAARLALPLTTPPDAALAAAAPACITASPRVEALTGLPSLAEAAALAAAGPGARLLGPRRSAGGLATCALATTEPAP
ncbi:cobalamin biosynthesis protein [Belnapia sp. T18]|uniref:Cobalamin biosynthesis protein n=2 Tax=Belnapia arida TaxID=2804533 RepID=A0ABS1U0P2_9PROT|nr:cobalamin biosynthesis protein [Belnapia arida]